jgi:PAS domain S-box-containing protein
MENRSAQIEKPSPPRLRHLLLLAGLITGLLGAFLAYEIYVLIVQQNVQKAQRIGPQLLAFMSMTWLALAAAAIALRRALLSNEKMRGELIRAQTATRTSAGRKLALLQSSLDGIVSIDANGLLLDFNAAAERMFGYAESEVLGRPMHDFLIPTQHRAAHQAGLHRYGSSGVSTLLNRRIEVEALCADGRHIPVELTIVPVKTEAGEIFTATLRDISERIKSEQALRASRDLLDKTGRIGGVGGWEFDVQSHDLRWTEETLRIHDLEPGQQPTLQEAIEFFAPEAQAQLRQAMQLSIARGEGFDLELPLITAKGRKLWVRAVSRADMQDGRPVRLSGAIQDITARRRVEAELAAARQRELQVGARIQQTLLMTPTPSQLQGLQISSFSQASQGIDGDFVEVIQMGEHCVDLIAGDVMGKGLAAAMMGAGAKLQFSRSVAELLTQVRTPGDLPRPAAVVAAVHRAMTPALQSLDAFVTLCYLRIDTKRQTVTWVGCGHEETLLVGRDGGSHVLPNQHPPLGVLDAADYVQDERPLGPDDVLFMYSDGVTDAMRADGERVGHQRMHAALLRQVGLHQSPAAVLNTLRRDLLGPKVQMQDDVTMVVVKHRHQNGSLTGGRIELPLALASLRPLREFVLTQALSSGIEEVAAGLLEVACVEAFTNVVRHARGLLPEARAEIMASQESGELLLDLVYLGDCFEPPEELPETNFGEFPEGGFGLAIIRGASDRVEYLHVDGVNTLRLHKRLD